MPVTVSGCVPAAAPGFTEIVSLVVPDPVTDPGLNEALVREGKPVTLKFTVDANGPMLLTVTVYEPFVFLVRVWLLGVADSEKSATDSVTCVEWVRAPLLAVIVSEYLPTGVEADVVTASVVDPEAVTEVGVKV